jgi:hypothetical protein
MKNKDLEIHELKKQINELYVLIDTLQTNLKSTASALPKDKKSSITEVRSYKWCINWKPGDEST